jgi:uncharacterized Fe-S radical SAM superfamily protein PflX
MNKDRIFFSIILVVLLTFAFAWAAEKERPTKSFMRKKLTYSQGILEGLTLEKYDLVITNATLLRNMNFTNNFTKMSDPYYAKSIADFQTKVDVIIKSAKDKLLEGSTEAYTKMLESCVACHKECRVDQIRRPKSSGK